MFKEFRTNIQKEFSKMLEKGTTLYVTDVDKDLLWETYLNSFEDLEIRQSNTCNCCRQFIKNYGSLVTIVDNKLVSLWNFSVEGEFEKTVVDMNKLISNSKIKDLFLSDIKHLGTDKSTQKLDTGNIIWEHMYLELPKGRITKSNDSLDTIKGSKRDSRNVFKRSLDEITLDAVETVLELISQNSLYKGEEFKGLLSEFLKYKKEYSLVDDKDIYCWNRLDSTSIAILKIRNSAIGTLLTDLSEGKELDHAVAAFEKMVAPTNYKRPTALVTKRMIEDAEKILQELGLTESLERRFAVADDISVNNLLFVNRDIKKNLGIFDELKDDAVINPKTLSKVEEVSADVFVKDILPTIKSIEVLFENNQLNNLVSLIAPKKPEAPSLFKWDNLFSWSYTNAVTDSIKEQVKAAGGKVEGELRISLSWFNYDDLDLHVFEPSGNRIYYGSKRSTSGGHLDVDMNAGSGTSRSAVENIIWDYSTKSKMYEGTYKVLVNNFNKRENKDGGFIIEIEQNGELYTFEHDKSLRYGEDINVVEFNYTRKNGIQFNSQIKSNTLSKDKWGISTNKFQKVSMVLNSPNYWDKNVGIGNRHLFFILDGVKNDETPRGFFNEFLKEELLKNKRVFELLGSKIKIEPSETELSGLGFSSTQKNSVICKVEGKFTRLLKVVF